MPELDGTTPSFSGCKQLGYPSLEWAELLLWVCSLREFLSSSFRLLEGILLSLDLPEELPKTGFRSAVPGLPKRRPAPFFQIHVGVEGSSTVERLCGYRTNSVLYLSRIDNE